MFRTKSQKYEAVSPPSYLLTLEVAYTRILVSAYTFTLATTQRV